MGRPSRLPVAHDGTREGVHQAEAIARLITATPQLRDLLSEAIHVWAAEFDAPSDVEGYVSGADLIDWFAQWRLKAKAVHAALNLPPALHKLEDCAHGRSSSNHPSSSDRRDAILQPRHERPPIGRSRDPYLADAPVTAARARPFRS